MKLAFIVRPTKKMTARGEAVFRMDVLRAVQREPKFNTDEDRSVKEVSDVLQVRDFTHTL